jgi:DNA invertase Pin-like site-specific DNA recombinase
MKNAVLYARYSSTNQTEQSIEGQVHVCEKYAAQNDIQIVRHYIDRAISGTSDNRPQFQQMIADSRHGNFEIVLVYKLDRFARNRYDSAIYKKKLRDNGARVVSATENITDSPEGIIGPGDSPLTGIIYLLEGFPS